MGARPSQLARIDHRHDRQVELLGELEVAGVVGGHGHDRPGAVADQHVIGHPDRNRLAVDRIDGVRAGEDAGLLLGQVGAVQVALAGRLLAVRPDRRGLLGRGEPLDQRMLRRDHHVGGAEERVGPGGVDPQHVVAGLLGKAGRGRDRASRLRTARTGLSSTTASGWPMKKSTSAPVLRPIQFRCKSLMLSGQSSRSRSFSSRSA